MPETTPTARCTKCGRPKSVGDKASLTQWIVCCNCVEGAPEAPAPEPLDLCSNCKKRISGGRAGSFTQWVFRSDLCNCEVPEAMRPSFDVMEQELPHSIEEGDELELEGEPPFPLDRYKPLMELGKGTSGHVYLCKDRLLEKKVAIKCLWAVTPEQLIGFQREAKATSLLSHPGVVSVLDFGGTAGGAPYMVMEYVEGTSLFDYISEHGPLPVEIALPVFERVAEALAHAHEKGVFHRDVKSSNILLCRPFQSHGNVESFHLKDGDTEVPDVRVIDFGVAGVKQAIHTPSSEQGDTIVGTPAYMSPDQAQGLAYDQRSEVYSLGCVMYEALTGKPPFHSDTALETISKHAHETAPLLADSDCNRSFSPELESLVGRCLEKVPADRFQSMKLLIEAIRNIDGGRQERTVSEVAAAPQSAGGNKSLKLIAILGGVILIAGIISVFALNVLDPETLNHVKLLFSSRSDAESQELASEAWVELEKGNNEKAIELSTRALSRDGENFRALDTRGVAYFLMGDTKNALLDLNKVISNADKDEPAAVAARFHRDLVYIAIGKRIASKSYIPSSYNTYVPTKWEARTFSRWINQDWRLLPLNAPGQVGGDPSNWPKDFNSGAFSNLGTLGPKAKEFDSQLKAKLGDELELNDEKAADVELRPGMAVDERTNGQNQEQKFSSEFFPATELAPAIGEEIDEFSGVDNFTYSSPTEVKVSALSSGKDIDKIIKNPKIDSITFSRVPIPPAVLSRIKVLPLKELVFQDYRATDKDLEFLRSFKVLDHFSISHGLGTGTFLSNLPADTMVDLVLRAMKNFDRAGLDHIAKLRHLKTLQINSLRQVGNSGIKVAVNLPLESLTFTPRFDKSPFYHNKRSELDVMPDSKFDYYDVEDLRKIIAKPTLKKLVLDSDGVKDPVYDMLSRSTVSELILQGQKKIKPENLKALSNSPKIRALFFCGDVLDESSAAYLSGLKRLSAIYLFHIDVDKKTFAAMSKLKAADLVIVSDQLNSDNVQSLAEMKHIRRMKIVDQSLKLTKNDIDALQEKIPACSVKLKDQH